MSLPIRSTADLPPIRGDFLVYDYEASGTDTSHDQALQFGGARLDASLDVVETYDVPIRRLPYVVPSQGALTVTGIRPDDLDSPARKTEFEAMREIDRILVPPYGADRRIVYYNGMSYDEKLTRVSRFRNLLDPYVSSYKGIRRLDVREMAELAIAMKPTSLGHSINAKGMPSFRLEDLCAANGIRIQAHDATSDSVATSDLMRLIRNTCPLAFAVVDRVGAAYSVDQHLASLRDDVRPAWLFRHFGAPELVPFVVLKQSGSKRWLVADVRASHSAIVDALSDLDSAFSSGRIKDCPVYEISAAKAPLILSADEVASFSGPCRPAAPLDAAAFVRTSGDIRSTVAGILPEARRAAFELPSRPTSEERIYESMASRSDKDARRQFHATTSWIDRTEIRFQNPVLAEFAARILRMTASEDDRSRHPGTYASVVEASERTFRRPFTEGPDVRWTTIASAREDAGEELGSWLDETFLARPEPVAASATGPRTGTRRRRTADRTAQLAFGF